VADLTRSGLFYDAVAAPLGWVRVWSSPDGLGYGEPGHGDKLALFQRAGARAPGAGFHLAFNAPHRAAVDAFHTAALASGGLNEGSPGLRPKYGDSYYAAFVLDPDGYKLEAVHQ
jgi:catechol 2,3-dioxygenase-like lactoylglutathione lyase family enzyme